MPYWLVKTEPDVYSIDDLERDGSTLWTGVRNYQARNYLVDMKRGDKVLVYHSSSERPSVAGVAVVISERDVDPTQFEKKGEYFDPKASEAAPRWFAPRIEFEAKADSPLPLSELRSMKALEGMVLLQKGSRLSVQPVSKQQFDLIVKKMGC